MFTRLRWFLYGVVATTGVTAYLLSRVRRMRERMTPGAVARAGALAFADGLEVVGRRLGEPRGADLAEG